MVRVPPLATWEETAVNMGVASYPPTLATAEVLETLLALPHPALLPAWGCVAWPQGSLKHKTTAVKILSRLDFHIPPNVVETGRQLL